MQRLRQAVIVILLGGWPAVTQAVHAQAPSDSAAPIEVTPPVSAPATETTPLVTPERIDQFQKSVDAAADLSEADKALIAELIQQATADLQTVKAEEARAAGFERTPADLEAERAKLQQALAQPIDSAQIAPGRSITDLETERVETQGSVAKLEESLKGPTVDPAARTARRKAARALTTELPAKLAEIEQKQAAAAPDAEAPLVTQARKLELACLRQVTKARQAAAQKELTLYDAGDALNLPTLRRESLTRNLIAAQKRLEALNAEINRQRQAEAERRALEAEMAAMNAQPVLKKILEESQEIARTEQELRSQHEDDKKLLQEAQNRFKELQDDAAEARRLDRDVGLEKMGIWLQKQRESLQNLAVLNERLTKRSQTLDEAEFGFYERKDRLDDLADIEARVDELVLEASLANDDELEAFREDATEVLRSQSVNLLKLVDEYGDYTTTLATLDKQHQQLREAASEYSEFLDERILWVRSHLPLSLEALRDEAATLGRIFTTSTWLAAVKSVAWDATDHRLLYASVALLFVYLILSRNRHGCQLQEVARRASGRVTTSISPTVHCLVLTIWLSIIWPGLILFFAWRLHVSTISSPELQVAALNLARLASIAFLLEFVRQSIRPYGLADAHFDWNAKTLRRVRRLLWSVMIFGLPIAAAVACLHQQDAASRRDVTERLLFIASMLVLSMFAHGLLHPARGALRQMKVLEDGGWFSRLDHLWYFLAIGVPLVLAGFAIAGYYDTAVRLAVKVQRTAWLVVAAVYLHALIVRWLMLRHRRLRIDKARERLAAAAQEPVRTSPESGAPLPDVESDKTNLDSMSQQSERLMSTTIVVACLAGLWLIWVDVLPAIRFLDRWPIWETTTQVMQLIENENGETVTRPSYEVQAVTIASLVQVLVIVLLTSTAARNIPGLLEISILPRLPIDRSTAYAITSLTRYGLVLLGLVLMSRALGIGWAKVQWLAAALTFGLGFGLQEIFANFVSGLIILFEQPVRVGDVVTIEGVSGVVNRIRIRATTIVDWDRKEYIVPNREFITGRLLNWTLSDKMNRIVINVGVAYGSNPNQVRSIMTSVVEAHSNVLEDPPPLVTFEAFGESSLDFVVRAYLPNLENRLQTIHDLHTQIHESLAVAGIEIPYPQRDLHLRTSITIDESRRQAPSSNGHSEKIAATSSKHDEA